MISRRRVLLGGAVAGTAAVTLSYFYQTGLSGDATGIRYILDDLVVDTGLGKPFDNMLKQWAETADLGDAWLAAQGTQPNLTSLAGIISTKVAVDSHRLEDELGEKVRQDFSQGNLVELDGWRLSETECQLAGLRQLAIASHPANQAIVERYTKAVSQGGYVLGQIGQVNKWGPQETSQGQRFNEQSGGRSAFWFAIEGAPNHLRVMIGDALIRTTVNEKAVTASVSGALQERLLGAPGNHELALVDRVAGVRQPVGIFTVTPIPKADEPEAGFCEITRWGPQETQAGFAANEQPDGSMGIWAHARCLPEDARVYLEDDRLPLVRTDFGFTTSIPLALLESPGEKPLYLRNANGDEEHLVGKVIVK